ncbi:hypothetical protein O181_023539 [Austropuccinia psidii MF-1]|uniref:Reverse transcriptase Ty1/copia-type domain-containing protein n=1 Tax=Austropuccinia psidii MF-1 TaxID=1389203 RepID=A0A9Q3CEL2_9BASI|nr:hypothetical protein [Austropuccinia psidii MF-1]
MKDLGKANLLLRIKILHNEAGFSLLQEHYIKNIAENFGITQLAPTNTPLKHGLQLMKASEDEIELFQKLGLNYRSIIGALNYIITNTRPDITFAISHLSHFLEQPSLKHWLASLQVLCYLYHTKGKTLNYYKGKYNIISYADADWGNSLINRRSVGGYTLFLNHHLISWRTKKQQTISHSTTETEYKSLSDASKEILWFQQLLQETNLEVPGNIPALCNDNKGTIDLAHSNINHNSFKAKHMDIKFHFIHDLIKNQKLELIQWQLIFLPKRWGKLFCSYQKADSKIIDANIETCNIITNSLDSSTFAKIVVGDEEMESAYLLWIGIEIGTKTLAFAILTKIPNNFNNLIEKVTLNTKTQGSPDAILNLLHDAALKEEALKSSFDTNIDSRMALNRETFRSKTIHYCSNGRHDPLASHPPEKCWQLHPEK